jgi:hypothetical protein
MEANAPHHRRAASPPHDGREGSDWGLLTASFNCFTEIEERFQKRRVALLIDIGSLYFC